MRRQGVGSKAMSRDKWHPEPGPRHEKQIHWAAKSALGILAWAYIVYVFWGRV
jgi:hypothetical protein